MIKLHKVDSGAKPTVSDSKPTVSSATPSDAKPAVSEAAPAADIKHAAAAPAIAVKAVDNVEGHQEAHEKESKPVPAISQIKNVSSASSGEGLVPVAGIPNGVPSLFTKDSATVAEITAFCKEHSVLYVDPDFPATQDSLFQASAGHSSVAPPGEAVEWRRPK